MPAAIGRSLPPRDQRGFGLLGIIVTLALSAVVVGVGYTVYIQGDRARQVSLEAGNAQAISNAIRTSYASAANYIALTQTSALRDKLFPAGVLVGGQAQSTWGGPIVVSSTGAGKGYLIEFDNVPANTCARFAANGGQGFADVTVNGSSVVTGKAVQMASAVALCAATDTNVLQFINYRPGDALGGNPGLTSCVVQPDQTQMVGCPTGQISSVPPYSPNGITQGRSSSCPQPYGPVVWGPWTPTANTCAPICSAPPATTGSGTQSASCPSGQVTPAGASSFTQTETRSVTYSCPAPTGPYATAYGPWSPWSPTVGTACSPACVAPPPTTQTGTQPASCPSGQVTPAGASSFTQTQTRSVTYSCPAPTGVDATAYGPWSPWSPTAGTACAAKCVAPPTATGSQSETVNYSPACPAGDTGTYTYSQNYTRTTTTTYSCPAPTGPYATNPTTYGPWVASGNPYNVNNQCVAPPPPAPPPPATYSSGKFCIDFGNGLTCVYTNGPTWGNSQTPPSYFQHVQATCSLSIVVTYAGQSQTLAVSVQPTGPNAATASQSATVAGKSFTASVNLAGAPNGGFTTTCSGQVGSP
ncbi:hypothetical protein B0E46_07295 [Rhodanobacter sp. B04]|nr:hypothetical protein B0E46_07295 [Rhodanobacter sp. B04]